LCHSQEISDEEAAATFARKLTRTAAVHRTPRRNDHDLVGVRIAWNETELRAAVKQTGAIWRPRQRLWEMSWEAVRALGIGHRVVTG